MLRVTRTHEHPESKLQGGGGHGQVVAVAVIPAAFLAAGFGPGQTLFPAPPA